MLAPADIPAAFTEWNRRHRAPFGYPPLIRRIAKRVLPHSAYLKLGGCFSIQPNNTTRVFEFPWAFHAAKLDPGMRVIEFGGGLGGFQFALDRFGCTVVNVDPDPGNRSLDRRPPMTIIDQLNRAFGTSIDLRATTIEKTGLESDTIDRIFSIGVFHCVPDREIEHDMQTAFRILKPGRLLVITLDLYLNTAPFAEPETNVYGRNVDVRWLCELAPFELLEGERSQLFGFPDFDHQLILRDLQDFLVGLYPALSQCFVLRKPEAA
jgi:SAM-dependent methyltransferase